MLESLGTIGVIIAVVMLWFGRDVLKQWLIEREEDMLTDFAEKAPERTERVQEASKKMDEVETKYENIVSATSVLRRARGE